MKNCIYIICSILLLLSCTKESDLEIRGSENGSIILNLKPNDPSPQSKAAEPGNDLLNENKIENIHLFFFPQNAADNQTCIHYESVAGLTFLGLGTLPQVLTARKSLFMQNTIYDIYTVVNLPANVSIPAPITLGALKSLRTITPISSTNIQPNLVMDGKVSAVPNPIQFLPIVYIDMPVKRAVSKIRVKFVLAPTTAVSTATVAQVSLRQLAKNGTLLDGNPAALTAPDYDNSNYVTATSASTFTFYCYENNWSTTAAAETYLMVNLPYLTHPSNYYRIPINTYANTPQTGRIERNRIYDVTAYIDRNGTENEAGTVAISSNCTITNWTTNDVVLNTINQHYLGISEYNISMPNTATFTLNYASDLPVSITNVTATCTQYSINGTPSNVIYTSGQPQFPVFTVNAALSTITITSTIPINYVPKYMTFTVTNSQGLSLNATIVQYPAQYVTARISTGNVKPEWFPGGTNLNLFTVNTLVPSTNGSYTLGDPTSGFAKTDSTAIGNKMVSPRFIIASQYGVYSRVTYNVAQTRCFLYGEDIYRSGWRMPTKAEIELINNIQNDSNSAVKGLLTENAYWSAFKYDYYSFTTNSWTSQGAAGTAFVKAVYDLYKDEQ